MCKTSYDREIERIEKEVKRQQIRRLIAVLLSTIALICNL